MKKTLKVMMIGFAVMILAGCLNVTGLEQVQAATKHEQILSNYKNKDYAKVKKLCPSNRAYTSWLKKDCRQFIQ